MYAIVEIAGQQFKVEKDQKIYVHRLNAKEGDKVTFSNVLLTDDNEKVNIGTPNVLGAEVVAKVLSHMRADKVKVFKKKRRKGYQKLNGHRQDMSNIEIESISLNGKISEKKEEKKAEPKKVAKKPVEKKVETKKVETKKVEPKKVETKKVETKKVETKKVETKKVEPKKVETKKVETKKVETKKVEPKTKAVADKLPKIEGIGPKIASILIEAGIDTFKKLSTAKAEKISEILVAAGGNSYNRFDPTTWPKQAKLAADGKWDELKVLQDKLNGGKIN